MARRYQRERVTPPQSADFSEAQTQGQLTQTLLQFRRTVDVAGARLGETLAARDQAGVSGPPKLKSNFTLFGRAYNNVALRNYAISVNTDIERELGRLEGEAAGDPDKFQALADGVRKGILKEAPGAARGDITLLFNRRMSEGIVRLDAQRREQQKQFNRGLLEQGLEVITDGISRKYTSGDPSLIAEAEEDELTYNLMIEGAASDGTITPVEAAAMKQDGRKRITEQQVLGEFERQIQSGDPITFIENLMNIPVDRASLKVEATKLSADEERKYREWLKRIGQTPGSGYRIDDAWTGQDYDYRGFFKKYGAVDVKEGQHFTDEFKLPNHETFSNESRYATGAAAQYAGHWNGDTFVPPNPVAASLSEDDKQKLVGELFTRLNRRNALVSMSEQTEFDTMKARYEAGEKYATQLLLEGKLTAEKLAKLHREEYLESSVSRTLNNELESGGAPKDDPQTRFHVETNLLDQSEEDITSNPRLTWDTKRELIEKRRELSTGWRATQQAREGAERIDRALGIVPGTPTAFLSEEDLRARDQALTEWYDVVDALPPEERQLKAIDFSQQVIQRVIRGNANKELSRLENRLRQYQQDKDPTKLKGAALKEYQDTVARYERQIAEARKRATP